MSHTELIMSRRQIAAIIQSDPIDIVLVRTPLVPDGAGGYKKDSPTPLKPQTVTVLPFKRRFSEMIINTELGDVVDYPYVIVGYPELNIMRGDTFEWGGDQYEVHSIDPKNQDVRIVAAVNYSGGRTNG